MDIFHQLKEENYMELMPGFRVHFIHTDQLTLAYWKITKGSVLPEHAHVHEQSANVLSGKFSLTVNGETKTLQPGMVACIPSNAVHSGVADTDCEILDIFYPIREEYRNV